MLEYTKACSISTLFIKTLLHNLSKVFPLLKLIPIKVSTRTLTSYDDIIFYLIDLNYCRVHLFKNFK